MNVASTFFVAGSASSASATQPDRAPISAVTKETAMLLALTTSRLSCDGKLGGGEHHVYHALSDPSQRHHPSEGEYSGSARSGVSAFAGIAQDAAALLYRELQADWHSTNGSVEFKICTSLRTHSPVAPKRAAARIGCPAGAFAVLREVVRQHSIVNEGKSDRQVKK